MDSSWLDSKTPDTVPQPPDLGLDDADFEAIEPLESAGSARMYTTTVTRGDDEYALVVKEPRSSGTLHRREIGQFRSEAETWANLDEHDHIVTIVDWGTQPVPWVAMEYMNAGTLRERVGESTRSLSESLWVATRLARALRHAHRHGIVHLDLKPANVLFQSIDTGDWAIPKITDWGLARRMLDEQDSPTGYSRQYAAPEQFRPGEFDGTDNRTDIFQFGAVCHELMIGRPPFDREIGDSTQFQIGGTYHPPSEIDPSIPSEVDRILETALATDPADRFEDVLDLRRALYETFEEVVSTEGVDSAHDEPRQPTDTDTNANRPGGETAVESQSSISAPAPKESPDLTHTAEIVPDASPLLANQTDTVGFTFQEDLSAYRAQFGQVEDNDLLPATALGIEEQHEAGELIAKVELSDESQSWDTGEPRYVGINPARFMKALDICDIGPDEYDPRHFSLWRPDQYEAPFLVEFPRRAAETCRIPPVSKYRRSQPHHYPDAAPTNRCVLLRREEGHEKTKTFKRSELGA